MKKTLFKLFILFPLLASFSTSFLGCSFEILEKQLINRPDLNNSSNGIDISLKNSSIDTLYVNIYRQDVTNFVDETKSTEPIVNIGIIFAQENNSTFVYQDNYVIKGKKYRYRARLYSQNDGYTFTNWTEGFTATAGINEINTRMTYGIPSSTKFVYDEDEKKITVSGEIFKPNFLSEEDYDKSFLPALIFQTENGTTAFKIDNLNNNKVINLTSFLPLDFQNIDIKFLGIIGQKTELYKDKKTGEDKNQRIIWTEIAQIPLYNKNGILIENQTIKLQTQYGEDGFDYSY